MAAIPTILKGDDSGPITISLATGRIYTNAQLVLAYQGVTRVFTNLTPGGVLSFSFTHDETANFKTKTAPILMRLVGQYGAEETVENAEARIKVTDCLAEVNAGGSFVVRPGGGAEDPTKVPITDVGDMATRYTLADLQAKVNQIVHVLAQRSLLSLAVILSSAYCFASVQTARLDSLYNDSQVVTNVIESTGIETNGVNDLIRSYDETNLTARINNARPPDYTTTNAVITISATQVTNDVAPWAMAGKAEPQGMTTNAVREIVTQTRQVEAGLSDWICSDGISRHYVYIESLYPTRWATYDPAERRVVAGDTYFVGTPTSTNGTLRAYSGSAWTNTTITARREMTYRLVNANGLVTFTDTNVASAETITNAAIVAANAYADTKNPVFQVERLPTASFAIPSNRVYQVVGTSSPNRGWFFSIGAEGHMVQSYSDEMIYGGVAYIETLPRVDDSLPMYSNRILTEPAHFVGTGGEPREYDLEIFRASDVEFIIRETDGGSRSTACFREDIHSVEWVDPTWKSMQVMSTEDLEKNVYKIGRNWYGESSMTEYPSTRAVTEYVAMVTNALPSTADVASAITTHNASTEAHEDLFAGKISGELQLGTYYVFNHLTIWNGVTVGSLTFNDDPTISAVGSDSLFHFKSYVDGTQTTSSLCPDGSDLATSNMVSRMVEQHQYTPSPTDQTFSNAVLAVGLNIDTNSVAVLNEIAATFGGFPIAGTATTVGGLLAALAAAIAWLRKKKIDKITCSGVADITTENGTANVSTLFTSANTSLMGVLPYTLGASSLQDAGQLVDREINNVTSGETVKTLTLPARKVGVARDFIIRVTIPSTLTNVGGIGLSGVTAWEGDPLTFTKGTDDKVYLVTVTEMANSAATAASDTPTLYIRVLEVTAQPTAS